MIDYEFVLKKFKEYVNNFDTNDKGIAMKISHSYHVADLANKLAKRMELNEEDTLLAKTIGLLHDIGRFAQYERTHEYNDIKTYIDHGQVGSDYLFQENHIEDFKLPEKYYQVIQKAILNHNKLTIETDLNEQELFFVKLIRDIDKIDVFRQNATEEDLSYKESVSKEVANMYHKHALVDLKKVKSDSDDILYTTAFAFDINFQESYELLEDTDNLELYFSVVEVDKHFEEELEGYKREIRDYIKERLEETC